MSAIVLLPEEVALMAAIADIDTLMDEAHGAHHSGGACPFVEEDGLDPAGELEHALINLVQARVRLPWPEDDAYAAIFDALQDSLKKEDSNAAQDS